jgi:hypothetical protein
MRFKEITSSMLGATFEAPGQLDDGKSLADALPAMATIRLWSAIFGGYSWSIVYEPGLLEWSEKERKQYVGYTATYRRLDHHQSSQTIAVDGGPFASLLEAEDACQRTWCAVRNSN